jgi:hypothetical protein
MRVSPSASGRNTLSDSASAATPTIEVFRKPRRVIFKPVSGIDASQLQIADC